MKEKTPHVPRHFSAGPPIAPLEDLVIWLDDHADRIVRLPVTIWLSANRLGIARATVGGEAGMELALDDAAMGVSLLDRLRARFPEQTTCPVWLDGRWRLPGEPDQLAGFLRAGRRFSAFAMHGVLSPRDELRVLVADPAP
jgi:hypothetical protein